MLFSVLSGAILALAGSVQASSDQAKVKTANMGCDLTGLSVTPGMKARFFSYSYNDQTDVSDPAFYASGYTNGGLVTTALVEDPNFYYTEHPSTTATANIYGVDIEATNFAMDLTGYFYAEESGLYAFDMTVIDDGAMIWMGSGGFNCCDPDLSTLGSADTSVLFATKNFNGETASQESWVFLEAGFYYPIRIVYINALSDGAMQFTITDPKGKTASVADYVYQLSGNLKGNCPASTFTTSMSYSTIYDVQIMAGETLYSPVTTTISGVSTVYIAASVGVNSILTNVLTVTTSWSGLSWSTSTGATIQNNNAESVVYIYKPKMSTSYVYGTQRGTSYVTQAGSIYEVDYVQNLDTSYSVWDQTGYSTFTSTGQYYGTWVEVYGPSLSNTYVFSGTKTKTVTSTVTSVDASGSTHYSLENVVFIPPQTTITSNWDKLSFSSTTQIFSNSNGNGAQVIVYRPNMSTVTTSWTNQWEYSSTSTAVYTDASGSTHSELVIYDYKAPLETTFSLVKGATAATTITSTKTKNGAQTELVIIEIPAVTSFISTQQYQYAYATSTSYEWISSTNAAGEDAGYWGGVLIVPTYSQNVQQWSNKYTSLSTSYNTVANTYVVYEWVPSYSQSLSFWNKAYTSTTTELLYYTDSLGVFRTSTYVQVIRPPFVTTTRTWQKPFTTTETTLITFLDSNQLAVTSSEVLVEVPDTENVINSWKTSTSYIACSLNETVSTSFIATTIGGSVSTIGFEIDLTPNPTWYLEYSL
ncbi:hypothetical protein DAMA08_001590 [Martiniozyma asiatica (nom. inval.)]|nr:hypothetical protein DAMA08_001590 [Martiniozyma asiatica]